MTGTTTTFTVEPRQPGKSKSGQYRRDRKIPAVIYGPKMENQNCLIDEIFVLKHSGSRHESSIFQTQSDDKKLNSLKVMFKRIDNHPVSTRPIHVDLYALDMTAKIKVNITIDFQGTPVGVKDEGGVLQTVLREVEIECNPIDIPDSISVNIEELKLNDSLHVSDISFPAGITPITVPERTICSVTMPKEEPAEPEVTAEGAEGAEGEAPAGADAGREGEAAPAGEKKES